MNRLLRKFLLPLPRLVDWYLSKKRTHRYQNLTVEVWPGIFHPGFFFSTEMLLRFVAAQPLRGTTVLELGAGTGLLSIQLAKMGAIVTATDISLVAIENIRANAITNQVSITVLHSDLFRNLQGRIFDWIFINPPYYARSPVKEQDHAWYCGEHHEYFTEFFKNLSSQVTSTSKVIMVLSDVCNLRAIFNIATEYQFEFLLREERYVWTDGRNYIYQIKPLGSALHAMSTHSAGK